jgi:hypothetical protein
MHWWSKLFFLSPLCFPFCAYVYARPFLGQGCHHMHVLNSWCIPTLPVLIYFAHRISAVPFVFVMSRIINLLRLIRLLVSLFLEWLALFLVATARLCSSLNWIRDLFLGYCILSSCTSFCAHFFLFSFRTMRDVFLLCSVNQITLYTYDLSCFSSLDLWAKAAHSRPWPSPVFHFCNSGRLLAR